jgi:hypothetical protein
MFIGPWRQRRRCLTAGQPILSGNIHNKTTTNTNGPAGLLLRKKDHFLRKTKSLRSVAVRQFRAPASCIFVFAIIGSQQREAAATLLLSAITAFPLALFALSLSLSHHLPHLSHFSSYFLYAITIVTKTVQHVKLPCWAVSRHPAWQTPPKHPAVHGGDGQVPVPRPSAFQISPRPDQHPFNLH